MSLGKKKRIGDDDFEMRDAEGTIVLDSPFTTPKQSSSQKGAPENNWAAQMNPAMFAFGDLPAPQRAMPQAPAATTDNNNKKIPEGSAASPNTTNDSSRNIPHSHRITSNPPRPDGFIRASGSHPGDHVAVGEAIHWNFHSLEAIRVAVGFVDTHLNDLLWFHDRVVDHHANLVRTRNLVRKALDGVARAAYSREQLDDLAATGGQERRDAER